MTNPNDQNDHNTPEQETPSETAPDASSGTGSEFSPAAAASASPISIALNIITSPAEAFREIERRPTKLFPLLTMIGAFVLMFVWYFMTVDFNWYVEHEVSRIPNREAADATREFMELAGRYGNLMTYVLSAVIILPIRLALYAGCLTLASNLLGDEYRFSHWFSLATWTSIVTLFAAIGMAVMLLTSDGQLAPTSLNPLSFGNLLGIQSNGTAMQMLLENDLTVIWGLGLMVIAYRQWLGATWTRAIIVAASPPLVFNGSLLLIVLI
ncbi:MAG: Yip1 family protein [Pseudohongiellaceae bacterium]